MFITGSDQVWSFTWYRKEYFLDFVPLNKYKMSYAASFGISTFNEDQKEIIKMNLRNFRAISVREADVVDELKELTGIDVKNTIDPTLLLSKEDWDVICSKRIVEREYVFAYFLGDNIKARKIAQSFTKKLNLELVFIPHANYGINTNDIFMNGIKIYGASPYDFISLIKYAKYVFTDSFHASVFSIIFNKNFFVYNRSKKKLMNNRIVGLLDLFDLKGRFCNSVKSENLHYALENPNIDYKNCSEKFILAKQDSEDYLIKNLNEFSTELEKKVELND